MNKGAERQPMFQRTPSTCAPLETSVTFEWSEPKVGFGQFYFYVEQDGNIVCGNEGMSKEFIKKKLCEMVDGCMLLDKE